MFGWFANKKWKYIGTVDARTKYVDENKNVTSEVVGYWILSEREDGFRKVEKVGQFGNSEYSINQEAAVTAWRAGGPLPKLNDNFKKQPEIDLGINNLTV